MLTDVGGRNLHHEDGITPQWVPPRVVASPPSTKLTTALVSNLVGPSSS